jgi:hypothetical protein
MRAWNTKKHHCLDLTVTEQMTQKTHLTVRTVLEWVQDQLIRRGILLTEPEQFLGYSEQMHKTWQHPTWRGSPVSNAVMPILPRQKRYYVTSEEEIDQPILPRLKTTSAYWPLEYKSYTNITQEAS